MGIYNNDDLVFYVPLNIILSHIESMEGYNERLCAMICRTVIIWNQSSAGLEPDLMIRSGALHRVNIMQNKSVDKSLTHRVKIVVNMSRVKAAATN